MSKKIAALLLALVMCISVISVPVSACTTISTGSVKLQVVEKMVNSANTQIAALIKVAQMTKQDDTAQLVRTTNAIAKGTIRSAKALGVTVVCEATYYWVDGKYIAIDPLKVAY